MKIAPSLLAANPLYLGQTLRDLENAGADMLHLDIMDGHFVPNLSFGPDLIKALRKETKLPLDVHLMISPVDGLIERFIDAGSDIITFHPEATFHPYRTLQTIKKAGKKAGLALNPGTPASMIEPFLDDLDLVLAMTVNPGFGGQSFMKNMLSKIRDIKLLCKNKPIQIEVDGGITLENKQAVIDAGADILVVGTDLLKHPPQDYAARIKAFKA